MLIFFRGSVWIAWAMRMTNLPNRILKTVQRGLSQVPTMWEPMIIGMEIVYVFHASISQPKQRVLNPLIKSASPAGMRSCIPFGRSMLQRPG